MTLLLALFACDRNGIDQLKLPSTEAPGVIQLGELEVIPVDVWAADPAAAIEEFGRFDTLGAPELGAYGGATFTFRTTGQSVCVIVDPELVFWNDSISPTGPVATYAYPDNIQDDGDLDLFAGLTSYYNGSPGVELGNFRAVYTDALGQPQRVNYQECQNIGLLQQTDALSGRGAPESCHLQTWRHEVGTEYTVLAQTFSLPIDDGLLDFGAVVVGARCSSANPQAPGISEPALNITECTIRGESFPRPGESDEAYEARVLGLEDAFCQSTMSEYCCAHPEACGEAPTADVCGAAE